MLYIFAHVAERARSIVKFICTVAFALVRDVVSTVVQVVLYILADVRERSRWRPVEFISEVCHVPLMSTKVSAVNVAECARRTLEIVAHSSAIALVRHKVSAVVEVTRYVFASVLCERGRPIEFVAETYVMLIRDIVVSAIEIVHILAHVRERNWRTIAEMCDVPLKVSVIGKIVLYILAHIAERARWTLEIVADRRCVTLMHNGRWLAIQPLLLKLFWNRLAERHFSLRGVVSFFFLSRLVRHAEPGNRISA